MDRKYHSTATKQISNYLQRTQFTVPNFTVRNSIFVVNKAWQPKGDALCVLDVWHFFGLFASDASHNSLENCAKRMCKYYCTHQQQRSKILERWFNEATNGYRPCLENAQPFSPTKRDSLASPMQNSTPVATKRRKLNFSSVENTPPQHQYLNSPGNDSVATQLCCNLMEVDLDVPFRYSRLICRRQACLFRQLNKAASHHRKMYIHECMHVYP